MAITVIKEPSGIYPAYNDSFVEFTSSLEGNNKAEVTVFPVSLFPNTFTIFPDPQGRYLFNLKEVVKAVFNNSGFKDSNFFTNAYFKSISGLYLLQSVSFEVFGSSANEVFSRSYEFYKSVKQIGESIFENPFQLLNHSENGVDYCLTYFEGFPFHFDIQRVLSSSGNFIKIKNLNNGFISANMESDFDGAFRVNVDRSGGENWTSSGFLPLINGENRLEIYEQTEFKTNLILKKKKVCDGVYLKWFNSSGGFSHWLFDEYFTEKIKGRDIDLIGNNEFQNVGSIGSNVLSIGKTGTRTLKIKTRCNEVESKELRSLFVSPFIEMYSSKQANVSGEFFGIEVEETYEYKNKKGFNEFSLTIKLPDVITFKL